MIDCLYDLIGTQSRWKVHVHHRNYEQSRHMRDWRCSQARQLKRHASGRTHCAFFVSWFIPKPRRLPCGAMYQRTSCLSFCEFDDLGVRSSVKTLCIKSFLSESMIIYQCGRICVQVGQIIEEIRTARIPRLWQSYTKARSCTLKACSLFNGFH